MKYAWMEAHRQEFELTEMCETLVVSESGYRAWKRSGTPNRKRLTDAQMLALIQKNSWKGGSLRMPRRRE